MEASRKGTSQRPDPAGRGRGPVESARPPGGGPESRGRQPAQRRGSLPGASRHPPRSDEPRRPPAAEQARAACDGWRSVRGMADLGGPVQRLAHVAVAAGALQEREERSRSRPAHVRPAIAPAVRSGTVLRDRPPATPTNARLPHAVRGAPSSRSFASSKPAPRCPPYEGTSSAGAASLHQRLSYRIDQRSRTHIVRSSDDVVHGVAEGDPVFGISEAE